MFAAEARSKTEQMDESDRHCVFEPHRITSKGDKEGRKSRGRARSEVYLLQGWKGARDARADAGHIRRLIIACSERHFLSG